MLNRKFYNILFIIMAVLNMTILVLIDLFQYLYVIIIK